jgi:hypothetical protein
LESGVDVIISEFDLAKLDTIVKHGRVEDMRGVIDAVTGTRNREFMPMGTGAGGALAFVVQSMVEDDVLDATFKTLRDAAKRQLSGTRPALLIAGFDGLDGEQLLSIAQQDRDANQRPTGLTIKISSFLTGSHRDHIVGVGFLSRSVLRPVTRSMIGSGGTAYYFPNRESPRRHDEFSGLFI